ncbi:hypothetical protein MKX01_008307 [Papaver californicum]|nr:hypothetical protein MKX01_008307 [Papaver californicum]
MAEEKQTQQLMTTSSGTNPPPTAVQTPIATPTFPPSRATPKLAFSGPAPERINGRLAMIGFVAAMGHNWLMGGLPWFVITSVVLSVASLISLFQGVSVESKSDGLMLSSAGMWNGRAAMLGLVALVLTEVAKGGALI